MHVVKRWGATWALLAGIVYFAAHALTGDQGVIAWTQTRHRIASLEVDLAALSARRGELVDQAVRLREATLDLDYLDERARAMAQMAHPRDLLIPNDSLPPELGPR